MNLKRRIEDIVQKMGMKFSYLVFSEKLLSYNLGKDIYLFLYTTFKKVFESDELTMMSANIPKNTTVIDIGANVGLLSKYFSKCVGSGGSVIAIEPDPVALDLLKYNLQKTKSSNVHVFPVACGSEDGEIAFTQNLGNRADNRVMADAVMMPHQKQIKVPVRSFSSLAKENTQVFQNISFIKMDVQGYEFSAVTGMASWLQQQHNKPTLCLELWPYGLKQANSSIVELIQLLQSCGYGIQEDVKTRLLNNMDKDYYETIVFKPQSANLV